MKIWYYDGTSNGLVAHEQRRGAGVALLMALLTGWVLFGSSRYGGGEVNK